jgi:heat-inducible transcriptional repressor
MVIQPEFIDKKRLEAIIEMVENKKMLVHLLDKRKLRKGVFITIGGENSEGEFKSFSVVTSGYKIKNVQGTLGIIGPTRMPYPKLISVVDYAARVLSKKY